MMGDKVHDFALTLNTTADSKHGGAEDGAAMLFENLGPDHEIGNAGLILQGDEYDTLGRARPLSDKNKPRDLKPASVAGLHGFATGDDALCPEVGTKKTQRMSA